jgi:hypothetical protein
MEKSPEQFMVELKEQSARLDEQRKKQDAEHAERMAEFNATLTAERLQRAEESRRGEEVRKAREAAQKVEEEKRFKNERDSKAALEQQQNAAMEAERLYKDKLEQLKLEISKVEFAEEQHRKLIENSHRAVGPLPIEGESLINVEHPVAPVGVADPGGAVEGTDGDNPLNALMSTHLRHILRQANRNE